MLPFITFPIDRFELKRGKPLQFHSSPHVTRSFCGVCGTPLTYHNDDHADEIDVMTCTLDDPEVFPPHITFGSPRNLAGFSWQIICQDTTGRDPDLR
jgi:hypothetical protein